MVDNKKFGETRETYGVARLDDVNSVYTGHIFSVIGEEDEYLENGMVGGLGKLRSDEDKTSIEREVRELTKVEGNDEEIVLVKHPAIKYEQYKTIDNSLQYFRIPPNKPARAYELSKRDVFSVSTDMVTALDEEAGVEVENFVEPEVGTRNLKEVADKPDGVFIGQVMRKDLLGTITAVGQAGEIGRPIELIVIEVLKNSL